MIKMSRTTIEIETHEIKIIRFGPPWATAECDRCEGRVAAITPEKAAAALNISLSRVYELIEGDAVHLVDEGALVCTRSLHG